MAKHETPGQLNLLDLQTALPKDNRELDKIRAGMRSGTERVFNEGHIKNRIDAVYRDRRSDG